VPVVRWILTDPAVDGLPEQVSMTGVPPVFLQ
jgi:hypothetical protein